MNTVQIRSAERALSVGTWLIVAGAMLYSVLTVTPLMWKHTPDGWQWTAPILPLVVDAAVVIVVRLDSVLAQLGGKGGGWPVALRWLTGGMTLALNVADSALKGDLVGVAVHAVAPLLLIVTAETGLAYRRAIAAAVKALEEQHRAERAEREQKAEERRRQALEERERERRERERAERERREWEAAQRREEREHAARLERERYEREAAERAAREQAERDRERREREERERREREQRERAEREHQERAERAERERRERERERQRAERERREQAEREAAERAALLAGGPVAEKVGEERARAIVRAAFIEGLSVRAAVELTGWSIGWVSSRYQELRDQAASTPTASVLEGASA